MAERLDDLDFSLISLLQENGRRPTSEIARTVQVPESTVRRRIDRLLRDHIITVVAVVQDPELVGLPVHVSLSFRVAPSDKKGVINALVACDEIRWVALTTGAMSLAAEGFFRTNDHLREFLEHHIASIEGIMEYRADIILDLYKNRFDWTAMVGAGDNGVVRGGSESDGRERSGS